MTNLFNPRLHGLRWSVLLLTLGICASQQDVLAQQQLMSQQPLVQPPQWRLGPATVEVRDVARFDIPDGFKYVDAGGARALLEMNKDPVPENLEGLLLPASGNGWWALLQYSPIGYVRDAGVTELDASTILKLFRKNMARQNEDNARKGMPDVVAADWEMAPKYDAAGKKVECALRVGSGTGASINQITKLLGRHGVLTITVVQASQDALDLTVLRQIATGITFKPGENYAGYVRGDKVANRSLPEVIASDDEGGGSIWSTAVAQLRENGLWAGAALGLAAAGCMLTAIALKNRKKARRRAASRNQAAVAVDSGSPATANVVAVPANENGHRNGGGRALPRRADRVRKRHFSYHAFYSEMVMNLSRCSYVGAGSSAGSGEAAERGTTGASEERRQGLTVPTATNILVAETSKLIESQQKLIEGQRKLIEEQTKLIHERSKLIDVETRVLEKQSELFAEQQLL